MTNKKDITRNGCMLTGKFAKQGYDWWWHSFTAHDEETGEEKSFFIEYFMCNPELGGEEPVFGQLKRNKEGGIKPSYLMVKAGAWGEDKSQLHRFFGIKGVGVNYQAPYSIQADDCFASEKHLTGSVNVTKTGAKTHPEWMSDSGSMSWDLKVNKKIAFNVGYGANWLMRKLQAFEMFWHAEGVKTEYDGWVVYNGKRYIVSPENCYGYADKNWGSNFTSPWVWLSSCNLYSKKLGKYLQNSAFDIGGGCPKIYKWALDKKLLSSFTYEGKDYEFNFSKFWRLNSTYFSFNETMDSVIWHVEQTTLFNKLEADITCKKADMLLVNYESPDGEKRHNKLWNGGTGEGVIKLYSHGNLIDEVVAKNVGCEYGEYDK